MLLLSVMFTGVVNMNTSLNAVYALRATYYRCVTVSVYYMHSLRRRC